MQFLSQLARKPQLFVRMSPVMQGYCLIETESWQDGIAHLPYEHKVENIEKKII